MPVTNGEIVQELVKRAQVKHPQLNKTGISGDQGDGHQPYEVVRYAERSGDFPRLMLKQGSLMPRLDRASNLRGLGNVYLDDAKLWFDWPPMADLAVQTLFQKKGFGMTLLTLSDDDQGGGSDIEDTFDRYTRWN